MKLLAYSQTILLYIKKMAYINLLFSYPIGKEVVLK